MNEKKAHSERQLDRCVFFFISQQIQTQSAGTVQFIDSK